MVFLQFTSFDDRWVRTSSGSFAATALLRCGSETSHGSLNEFRFWIDDDFIVEGWVWRGILVDLLIGEGEIVKTRRVSQ